MRWSPASPAKSPLSCAPGCVKLFQMGLDLLPLGKGAHVRFVVVPVGPDDVTIEFATTAGGFQRFAATADRLIRTASFPAQT